MRIIRKAETLFRNADQVSVQLVVAVFVMNRSNAVISRWQPCPFRHSCARGGVHGGRTVPKRLIYVLGPALGSGKNYRPQVSLGASEAVYVNAQGTVRRSDSRLRGGRQSPATRTKSDCCNEHDQWACRLFDCNRRNSQNPNSVRVHHRHRRWSLCGLRSSRGRTQACRHAVQREPSWAARIRSRLPEYPAMTAIESDTHLLRRYPVHPFSPFVRGCSTLQLQS